MADNNAIYMAEKAESSSRSVTFRIAEAYKMIRTNLLFTLANAQNRVVVFSSAEPSAGKSTLCANLAIVMAQTGTKVVLIDADMRKPVQHRNFHLNKSQGLSKVLGGLSTVEECLAKQVLPNLDVLPSGTIPPNPSELLGSARMTELLERLQQQYDYVFIDTPPVCVVADALVLVPQSAGAVLVARHKQTTYDELNEVVESLQRIGGNLLGVVLSDVRAEGGNYGTYEKKRYYHAYNYEYSSGKNSKPNN